MFGSLTMLLAVAGLAMLSAGGLAYALLYGRIETENRATERLDRIQKRNPLVDVERSRAVDAIRRRKSVQETLKEIEEKQKAKAKQSKSPPLNLRLEQAGLSWSRRTFFIISIVLGGVFFVVPWLLGLPLYISALFLVVGLLGLPRWIVGFLRKRRMNQFLNEFANAIDIIVRGIKAGLPLGDCIRIIAQETEEPVKGEFRKIVDAQALGISVAEAVAKMPDRIPLPETNFFAIVIAIQQKAGGNLAEALANLSRVLRERRQMKGKIKAMSMEAKASAVIIGILPFAVMFMTYLSSPQYIMLLFTDPLGNLILGSSAVWMTMGILVMRKMINFDF
jgi:tight adherence protein B